MLPPARKRARSIERLLKRATLPEAVQKQKEAEMAGLMQEAKQSKRVAREKLNSRKYHGVKFFERRKLERKIEALRKHIDTGDSSSSGADLPAELREAEHDLLYVLHFPRNKKYLSLFPTQHSDSVAVDKLRKKIRARIVRHFEAGTLGPPPDEAGGDDDLAPGERAASAAAFAEDDFFDGGDDGEEEAGEGERDGGVVSSSKGLEGSKAAKSGAGAAAGVAVGCASSRAVSSKTAREVGESRETGGTKRPKKKAKAPP
jgi:hypothetical protein